MNRTCEPDGVEGHGEGAAEGSARLLRLLSIEGVGSPSEIVRLLYRHVLVDVVVDVKIFNLWDTRVHGFKRWVALEGAAEGSARLLRLLSKKGVGSPPGLVPPLHR